MRTVAQVAKDVLQEVIIQLLGIWLRNPYGARQEDEVAGSAHLDQI